MYVSWTNLSNAKFDEFDAGADSEMVHIDVQKTLVDLRTMMCEKAVTPIGRNGLSGLPDYGTE